MTVDQFMAPDVNLAVSTLNALFQQAEFSPDPGPALTTALHELLFLSFWVGDRTRLTVVAARSAGVSWTDIGEALGVSRQAAQAKYARYCTDDEKAGRSEERA